jgi:16S rRNA (cytosine967-C5)-methyltransferase
MNTDLKILSDTRLFAVKALLEVFRRGAKPKQSVSTWSSSFDKRDRSFLMEMTYGVIRYRDTLDWVLRNFLKKPGRLEDFTLQNLRLAVYQIYFMRVPEWAVVNEAVQIEKNDGFSGRSSLVNAVLRNVIRQKDRFPLPAGIQDPIENISINTSHQRWMVRRWVKRFGEKEAALLAAANNKVPPLTVRTNTLRTTRERLLEILSEKGIDAAPTPVSPEGIALKEVRSVEELSFIHGLFIVQDEASQIISRLLDPRPGERILDVCAAPGGKTTHIAQLMSDRGEIVAVEKDHRRIARIEENISSLGIRSVKIVNADLIDLENIGKFDRIIVDAPCSATGIIRKNPDIKYRHKAADLERFGSLQSRLLRSAAIHLKEKGMMVYSVCSTEPEEGEKTVNDFLKTRDDFRIIKADPNFYGNLLDDNGFLKTYPHRHNMDGFFGVLFCNER